MQIQSYMREKAKLVHQALDDYTAGLEGIPSVLKDAMRYSLLAGGKRFRPVLVLATVEALGGNTQQALPFACAIEMIHTYSLIHDDLPAMDDDDYRRGKLANHKVFGEGIAILAGDALLTFAFEVLSGLENIESSRVLRLIQEVSVACGSQGLIGGQVVDLESEGQEIDQLTLEYIHRHKTGKLFSAALRGGAIIGGADEAQLSDLALYGENLGLAFQITDDILDVSGDIAKLGKATGADLRKGKSTSVSLLGLEGAKEQAKKCVEQCKRYAERLPSSDHRLVELAEYVLNRDF